VTDYKAKTLMPYSSWIDPTEPLISDPFFSKNLSCCLIHADFMSRLRLLGKNTFDNIWLIDRKSAMFEPDELFNKHGLILYLT